MLTRLSKHIFEGDGGVIVKFYPRTTHLRCTCNQFRFESQCEHSALAKEILLKDGIAVVFPRPIKPIFIEEIPKFQKCIKDYLTSL